MLKLENISFSVEGSKEILSNINLTIEDGKFTILTGPNGGGKSTLAKIIAGIHHPTAGKILMDDIDITEWSITERANHGISFAFQQPVRFKGITVYDLIALASGEKISTLRACDYLSAVGLCARDYIDREVNGSLSGGELKRIEIAITIARKSKISVFDEPEAGIDLWSFKNLIHVFENMHQEVKGAIVIISHQERILDIADEIVVLKGGEIVAKGHKAEMLPELLNDTKGCKYYE